MISSCSGRASAGRLILRAAAVVAISAAAFATEPNSQRVNHSFVGAAGESIAIQVPPFHGIEPRLGLSYSSEARNGFAGMGWHLTGFSVIERVNSAWGFPQFSADDVFTLDGQVLLECPPSSPYPSCASGGTHYTQQESYLKVKKVSDTAWEVYGKDGTRTEFTPIHSVPQYEGGPIYALRLGQSKVVDTHANTVTYAWATNFGQVNGATYPSSVTYNGYTVEFFREVRPDGPLTRGAWNDVGRQGERLKSIVVRQTTGAQQKIRAYKLEYTTSPSTGKSLLARSRMYGKNVVVDAGNISGGAALPAQTFTYQGDANAGTFTGDVQMSNAGPPATPAGTIENVVWSYRTNTTPSGDGSSLTGDAVGDAWDKTGYSSRALSTGAGYAQLTFTQGSGRTIYLGQFGMYLSASNTIMAWAQGSYITGEIPVSHGDVLRIEVVSGGVQWKVGATVVAAWSGTPSYPMVISAGLYAAGDQLAQVRLSGAMVNYFGADCGGSPRFSGDFNGDGRQDSVCKTALHDIAVTLATANGFSNPTLWANWGQNIAGVGDFNNDGKDDIVFFDSFWGKAYVGLSDGVDFGAISFWGDIAGNSPSYPWPAYACRMNGAYIGKVADFNGDGKFDVACVVPGESRQYVGISTGAGFTGVIFSEVGCNESYGNQQLQGQADFNGDGRDDWYCISTWNSDLLAFFSLGNSFFYPDIALTGFCSASEYSFGDWNGDGATDAACANNLRAGLQTGRLFAVLEAPVPAPYCVSGQRLAADLDGDGAAEWICNNPGTPGNDIEIRRWSGLAFGAAQTWRGGFCAGTLKASDYNGDGKKDLLCESTGAVIYAGTKNLKADLMTGMTNGIGGSTTITWGTSANVAFNLSGTAAANGIPAKYLVTQQGSSDGRTTPLVTAFNYYQGEQNDTERKFFGFKRVKETFPLIAGETGAAPYINRNFRTDAAAAGRIENVSHWDGNGNLLSRTANEYATTETTGAGARRTVQLSAVWNYQLTGLTADCESWPCPSGKRTKKSFTYDNYGNTTVVTDDGVFDAPGDETFVMYGYTPNPSLYIVGLADTIGQYSGTSAGSTLRGASVNAYDGGAWSGVAPTKGDLTKQWSWIVEQNRYTGASSRTYDSYGNLIAFSDQTGRGGTVAYDATYHTYPISATNGANETTSTNWGDYRCGVPQTTTDPNGVVTTFETDNLCRPTTTTLPSPYGVVETRSYADLGTPTTQKVRVETPGPDGPPAWTESYFDGFGRTYQTLSRGPSAAESIVTDALFDLRGNVAAQTAPYYANATAKITTFEYDRYNRRTKTTLPDGETRLVSYPAMSGDTPSLFRTTTTNELGQQTTNKFDVFGRPKMTTQVRNLNGSQQILNTTRNYDVLGRMTSLVDPAGNTWTYGYDSLGRNLTKTDPDAGTWNYTYDDAGRVQNYEDAKGQTISFIYDAAGRTQKKRVRPTGGLTGPILETVETTYGTSAAAFNRGRVTQVLTREGISGPEKTGRLSFEYDAAGRVVKQTRTLDGANYVVERNYDAAGYLRGIKYPDNDIIGKFGTTGTDLGYDPAGRLTSIPGILSSVTYNALGAPLVQTNVNNTTTTRTYDPNRFWLTDIYTTTPYLTAQNLHYTPNDAGMVMVVDSDVTNEDWTYIYDDLNRLTSATNGLGANNQTWAYDNIGRFTSNSRVGTTFTYPALGSARPHAPATISGGPLGALSFTYDNNGNMKTGNGRTMTWNADNLITQVVANSKTTTFTYGPEGDRIKKSQPFSPLLKYPFGDDYELSGPDGSEMVTKYFNAGFGVIAKKVGPTLYWLHTDRMGSINATTDAVGAQVLRRSYRSYGELLGQTGTHTESLGYIGQRTDAETANGTTDDKGLTYLHARYYDSALGIFLSPDPIGADRNTYRYSFGDSVNFKDPSGLIGVGVLDWCWMIGCFNDSVTVDGVGGQPGGADLPWWFSGGAPGGGPIIQAQINDRCVLFGECDGGSGTGTGDGPAKTCEELGTCPVQTCEELGNCPGSGNESCRDTGTCTAEDLGLGPAPGERERQPLPTSTRNPFGAPCEGFGSRFVSNFSAVSVPFVPLTSFVSAGVFALHSTRLSLLGQAGAASLNLSIAVSQAGTGLAVTSVVAAYHLGAGLGSLVNAAYHSSTCRP